MGRGRCRPLSKIRGGVGRSRARRRPGNFGHDRAVVATGDTASPSCSRRPLIQSAPASSRASLIRAVTSLGSPISDYSIGGKFLELLKDIAPRVTRAAVLRDPCWGRPVGRNPDRSSVVWGGV